MQTFALDITQSRLLGAWAVKRKGSSKLLPPYQTVVMGTEWDG